ncbi:Hypothetical protein (Fragment), partial [Durusdinium trenchii]
ALPRELRARKELPPVPSFHAQAKPAGGGAGGTSTAPVAPAGAGTGLLRHTEEDSRRVAIFRKERETKAALASLERREREGVEEDVVDLVSGYREGSYPDVEVSLADILEPLARAATEDLGLAEELLLAVWCGLTAKEVLSGAFNGLLSGCLGDVTLVHFLHSLVVRCSQDYGKTLPLPALQRTLGFSELSGIQARSHETPPRVAWAAREWRAWWPLELQKNRGWVASTVDMLMNEPPKAWRSEGLYESTVYV